MAHAPVLEVLDPGLGTTLQDRGRLGWRRYGVPPSGFMDDHAALWANRLLDNPPHAPLLEMLIQGAKFRVLSEIWIAITGADAEPNIPAWRAVKLAVGDQLAFPHNRSGVWIYLAVERSFQASPILGSVSVYGRGGLGRPLAKGDRLFKAEGTPFQLPPGVAGRLASLRERRDYQNPPALRVWRGPQWADLGKRDHAAFFDQSWTISAQSDRLGYRLEGAPLKLKLKSLISEPIRVGTIQIPENGLPLVTMRDGPTVGGYPKLGVVDPRDLPWLAQARPGQAVRFQLMDET